MPVSGSSAFANAAGLLGDAYRSATPIGHTWTPFGTGNFGEWSSSSGSRFIQTTNTDNILVHFPTGYISGDALSSTGTQLNATLSSLGMTPGTYVTTFTQALVSDTFTVIVQSTTTPAPVAPSATPVPVLPLWGLGVLISLLGYYGTRRMSK